MFVKWIRIIYAAVAWLFVAGVLTQVFLAGLSIFASRIYWDIHNGLGYTIGFVPMPLIILAILSRLPRATIGLTGLLFVLSIIQTLLPSMRGEAPVVAALHPVNALAMFWVALALARRSLAFVWAPSGTGVGRQPLVASTPPLAER